MSARRLDGLTANSATLPNATNANRPTGRPTVLPSIGHPPDFVANVITYQQCPIRHHQQAYRPSPPLAVGTLPAHDEILHSDGAMASAVHLDAHDLGAGRHTAIPRAVQCDEGIPTILAGELRTRVEREPERRRVRLNRDRRRLNVRAVCRSVLGIGFAGEVTLRPPVVPSILDDVDMLGRDVVAEVVAIVVAGP